MNTSTLLLTGILATGVAGLANAAEILVSGDITVSTTWTANNTYNLQGQVYLTNGATLTIQPGTVIASDLGGSLAVTRGSQIFALGTQAAPVIFTSKPDVATWVGGNPKTGTWRPAKLEWGNLTILGEGYVSSCPLKDGQPGNVPTPNAANEARMEGLTAAFPGDDRFLYGGGDDEDDSGTLNYVSLRYGGKVVGLNDELNGLSLGAIGRGTDISHVEIMNNVDDGVELWGGTVNLRYLSIWNIGDDSLDIDGGWRGKAQFGLIVQGASGLGSQGSGYGDNAIEHDGAEQSSWQPVTTGRIVNYTVIGQPIAGDHGTTWRDNCRMQYASSIFMQLGEQLVRNDNVDGDPCGTGYGAGGTLSFNDTWTTASSVFSAVNAPANPADFYKAQYPGNLAEIKNSIFFQNLNASAYTTATTVGVFAPANGNVQEPVNSPIRLLQRTANPNATLNFQQVTKLDPRAQNDALGKGTAAQPGDSFLVSTTYAGAFNASQSWLWSWTAADAFGFLEKVTATVTSRVGVPANLDALKQGTGAPIVGTTWQPVVDHSSFFPNAILDGFFLTGGQTNFPLPGLGTLLADAITTPPVLNLSGAPGAPFIVPVPNNPNFIGVGFSTQAYSVDNFFAVQLTNALDIVIGNQ
jgi:hypothetical protein